MGRIAEKIKNYLNEGADLVIDDAEYKEIVSALEETEGEEMEEIRKDYKQEILSLLAEWLQKETKKQHFIRAWLILNIAKKVSKV